MERSYVELPPQTPYPVAPNGHWTAHRRNRIDVCVALAVPHASQQRSIRSIHLHLADPYLREAIADRPRLVEVEVSQVAPLKTFLIYVCSHHSRLRHPRTQGRPAKPLAQSGPFDGGELWGLTGQSGDRRSVGSEPTPAELVRPLRSRLRIRKTAEPIFNMVSR